MLSTLEQKELEILSKQIQIETVKGISSIGFGHIGGSLSIADLLAVLYGKEMRYDPANPRWAGRDYLVLSKGHSGPAAYAVLALKDFFGLDVLRTLNRPHTILPSHCDRNLTPGIDMTAGSLGQGASAAAGIALGLKMDELNNRVYLILGDGEIQEGQVWEMALFAHQKELDNLIAFVDNNGLQIDGTTNEINSLENIAEKFSAFGWNAQSVDGHNVSRIFEAIEKAKTVKGKPSVIVLKTVKGHGWSDIEGKVSCHHRQISKEESASVLTEMENALNELKSGGSK